MLLPYALLTLLLALFLAIFCFHSNFFRVILQLSFSCLCTFLGCRIPFSVAFVLIFVGYYIRRKVAETPVFQELRDNAAQSKTIGTGNI